LRSRVGRAGPAHERIMRPRPLLLELHDPLANAGRARADGWKSAVGDRRTAAGIEVPGLQNRRGRAAGRLRGLAADEVAGAEVRKRVWLEGARVREGGSYGLVESKTGSG